MADDVRIADRYLLIRVLGRGGMGQVWQAYDERLHRKVAVKQLLTPAELDDGQAAEARRRAVREARIAARLQHKNVIAVFDVLDEHGTVYLIMEYLPSRTLAQVLTDRGTLPLAEVARIGLEIADGLHAAHQAGVVHRDVKPGNILLGANDTVKITDFGIARAVGDAGTTASELVVGTPAYMSPEVAKGERPTFASDVYSLGATLSTAIEGTSPIGYSDNAMALLYRAASGEITPPTHAGPLTDILARMLQPDPARRPPMPEVMATLAAQLAVPAQPGVPGVVPAQAVAPAQPGASVVAEQPVVTDAPAVAEPVVDPDPPTAVLVPNRASVRRRRRGAVLVTAAALLAAGIIAITAGDRPNSPDNTAAPATSSAPAPPSSTTSTVSAPTSTTTTTPPPPPSSQPPVTTTVASPAAPDAQATVAEYYTLMPGNLTDAWTRLTAKFRQHPAGGWSGYQRFWGQISSVRATTVTPVADNVVEATIEYRFKDGRTVLERHRYTLVRQDNRWKIDESTVLSSRTL
ncbi:protein kinase [Actinocrispum sp. NPDC049592]|uniref:serine/threonine-protein kinase n=1 Tax=Actinocrispum sp. NPDC049592 TaxID=3154835 RepID=UPI0034422079